MAAAAATDARKAVLSTQSSNRRRNKRAGDIHLLSRARTMIHQRDQKIIEQVE